MDLPSNSGGTSAVNASSGKEEGLIGVKNTKNSLQVVLDQWRAIDLDTRRNELDKQATEIADNKDASMVSRKKLAEQTKQFRKYGDPDKLSNFGNLLKLYQEEIDKLTKRSKTAENSFLSLYKLLAEAPDPVIGINAAMNDSQQSSRDSNRVGELDIENRKLRTELEEFRKEFQEVKNQEVTIRRLEDKIADYETKIQTIVEERAQATEKVLKDEQERTVENLREREQDLKRQLNNSQEELIKLQYTLEATQTELLDVKIKNDEKQGINQRELDMLLDELERARSRFLTLEREKERSSESDFARTQLPPLQSSSSADLELEVAQKDIEISQLKEHIQKLEQQLFGKTNTLKSEVLTLTEQLHSERLKIKQLTEDLKGKPTPQEYEEVKSQLDVLRKTLEYNLGAEEGSEHKTVEGLLKEKNKKLETENIQLKVSVGDLEDQLKEATSKLNSSQESVGELKKLVAKLEEDIGKSNSNSNKSVEEMFQKGAVKASEEQSMLQIVCNQRDRFKSRIMELEAENKQIRLDLESTSRQLESLRSDNISLFEKIRYLQSYASAQNDRGKVRNSVDIESGHPDELESRYSKLYEETVNPFVIFNRKEKYRRYKELNTAEKVVLNGGQFLMSTKFTRTFLFFYSVSLHLLVFATLYRLAHITTEIHPIN